MLRVLVIFLWLICIVVAIVATVQADWIAAIFWWAVVILTYRYDRKRSHNAR